MRRKTLLLPLVTTLVLAAGVTAWAEDDDSAPGAGQAADMADMPGMPSGTLPSSAGPAPAPAAPQGDPWSKAATWGGKVPAAGEVATVPAGKTVLLDTVTPALKGVVVKGTLVAPETGTIGITAGYIAVKGGHLQIGSTAAPFKGKATFTLTGTSTADTPDTPGMGSKTIAVDNGVLDLHGAPVTRNWTQLGADAAKGDTTLTLAEAPGWAKGDRIVIATSSKNQNEDDVATVASVSGTKVTLAAPLKYKHFGTKQTVGDTSVDVRAEVGLLSHNIVVQGDDGSVAAKVGAHIMLMGKGTGRIENVEVTKAGQLDHLGRYPIHFHMMGSGCSDCYVKNTSVHDTVQRGIVLHDSSGITLDHDVVYNTVGHNIIVETAGTTGNTISNNLALVNKEPSPAFTEATLKTQNDKITANFWFKSGGNKVSGNHAGGSFSNGYTYDNIDKQPITFTDNVAHAAMGSESAVAGDFDIKGGVVAVSEEGRGKDVIKGGLVYQSAIGAWPEEGTGPWQFSGFTFAENELQVENRGVGGTTHFADSTWVRKLPKGDASFSDTRLMHLQYGGDATITNPHIVGYSKVSLAGTDTGPTQARFTITNPSFSGGTPTWDVTDLTVAHFTDGKAVAQGAYYSKLLKHLTSPACKAGSGSLSDDVACPKAFDYAELDVRNMAAPGTSLAATEDIVRSDGLKYRRDPSPDAANGDGTKGLGLFGTTVSYDNGLTYAVPTAHSAGTAVGLTVAFDDNSPRSAPVQADKATVEVAVPVAGSPTSVVRSNAVDADGVSTPTASGTALKAVSSLAALRAAPLTSYYYDAAKKSVVVHASGHWVIVK